MFEALAQFIRDEVWAPLLSLPWSFWREHAWRDFWLGHFFIERYAVAYFLPLVLVLWATPPRYLRRMIIATGVVFLAYVFGAIYSLFWLMVCAGFFLLAERFAIESRRVDVVPWGPPLAAFSALAFWHVIVQGLPAIPIAAEWTSWLATHAPWALPLGARPWPWEPSIRPGAAPPDSAAPFPLLFLLFNNAHNIGLAYLSMRMLHYFSEIRRGSIPREQRTRLNFFSYLCYGPTLIQGPLERFREFHAAIDRCHETRSAALALLALARMAWGIWKLVFVIAVLKPFIFERLGIGSHDGFFEHPERYPTMALFFGAHLYTFWLYLEFSGYCDLAAGFSWLIGYRPIENFRWCWFSVSLVDLWRRWHISLSFMLRDYIFTPLIRKRWPAPLALCATFVLCGLWHVLTPGMFIWGIGMGLGVAVNQRWTRWMRELDRPGPMGPVKRARALFVRIRPAPRVFSWLLTMNAFCLLNLVFFGGTGGARRVALELLRRLLEVF